MYSSSASAGADDGGNSSIPIAYAKIVSSSTAVDDDSFIRQQFDNSLLEHAQPADYGYGTWRQPGIGPYQRSQVIYQEDPFDFWFVCLCLVFWLILLIILIWTMTYSYDDDY